MQQTPCHATAVDPGGAEAARMHGARPPAHVDRESMVWIPGGEFLMGSDKFYREERPARLAKVDGFWMDRTLVTNAEFAAFVAATSYVTFAERPPPPELYPEADPALLTPGSLVFTKPSRPVGLSDYRAWWAYVPGASWKTPQGPDSDLEGRADYPVVHIAFEDAEAYARWVGKSLPLEAEWEFAARGGLDGATYPWGDDPFPEGRHLANTWQGRFPWENTQEDGFEGASPVGVYPPNSYGLFDVVGNVWEWTASPYTVGLQGEERACCKSGAAPDVRNDKRVVKGGSHLCAPNYCLRFRPAARQGESLDTSTSHIGFRCIARP